ncbi:Calcium-binding and coiled-coil domain-containing protein 1 [Larimichthys crocea]|uniref:Uncharacterized protein n=1 Tax=Larimichthys crocea TaxID=215358 RepID=A0ACD3RKZ5_LARCR|nr:Calcium-binding and coiled-coil domain-containing protein 1 [Larimichthys crocea]
MVQGDVVKLLHLTGLLITIYRLLHSSVLRGKGGRKRHQLNLSAEKAQLPITMDKQPAVVFRNVGQLYFPQTRVECHYSLTPDHQWDSSDWIGIFEVGWSSVNEYYTYTWALVPEGYTEGTGVNCCVHFQAFFLPRPSTVEYEFVYVDKMGEVCTRSRPFTFCEPKPLDELETLKEEQDEEDGEEELLLVIPRAQLLQSRLEECLKQQADIQQALDVTKKEREDENENSKKTRMELKERVKKMSGQMKHDEEKRKTLQAENEAALVEMQGLRERLEASEHTAESLHRELRELGTRQGHAHTELHQARLQVAQLTLQLSEENLLLREERANWALERETYKHAAETDKKKVQELSCEVQRKEEWLQEERMERENLEVELGCERDRNRVLLSDTKRELQELKASLRTAQKEREEQQRDKKQDLVTYIYQLEQRLGIVPETKSNGEIPTRVSRGSSFEDDEDAASASPRSICSPLFFSTHLERLDRGEIPAETHIQSKDDEQASDTQDVGRRQAAGKGE